MMTLKASTQDLHGSLEAICHALQSEAEGIVRRVDRLELGADATRALLAEVAAIRGRLEEVATQLEGPRESRQAAAGRLPIERSGIDGDFDVPPCPDRPDAEVLVADGGGNRPAVVAALKQMGWRVRVVDDVARIALSDRGTKTVAVNLSSTAAWDNVVAWRRWKLPLRIVGYLTRSTWNGPVWLGMIDVVSWPYDASLLAQRMPAGSERNVVIVSRNPGLTATLRREVLRLGKLPVVVGGADELGAALARIHPAAVLVHVDDTPTRIGPLMSELRHGPNVPVLYLREGQAAATLASRRGGGGPTARLAPVIPIDGGDLQVRSRLTVHG